ncbi:MAG: two-component system sensor histidine kinase NtrB [Planctomycetota bacterium]|jgi:two-component system sensor histidine kinase AtoS
MSSPSGEAAARQDTPLARRIPLPAPSGDHLLRREAFLVLFCAAFAATVFLVWTLFRHAVLPFVPEQYQPPVAIFQDFLGPFLTAYIAARLYSSMVRNYEWQLQGHRHLLAHILDTSADGIVSLDTQNRVTTWNRGAEQIFGYTEEEIVGKDASMLFPDDVEASDELKELRDAVDRDGFVRTHYGERRTKDGRHIRTEVSTTALRDNRGTYAGRASIFRDVTERDRIREELAHRESLAAIGEMAAAVAHEIKNPLAGIAGAVQVIGRAFPPEDARAEVVEEVQDQVRRLDRTVREMLTFARPTTPHFTEIDLNEFVGRMLRVLGEEPLLKAQAIEIDVPEGLFVHADPQLLENILVNLLLNAAQETGEEGGRIRVRASQTTEWTRIAVTDEGQGVPDDVLPLLFKPFFTTRTRGTGLGLTIVRKFVGIMGGRIDVKSKAGEGTTFTVILRRRSAA